MACLSRRERALLCLVAALLVGTRYGTVNTSASVPLGIYRYVGASHPLQRGDLVQVPAVAFGRSWLASWLPLLKPVAAIPGDEICVTLDGLSVRGMAYGPVYQSHKGKTLPVFWGCHVVGKAEVFVASHEARSLDGRYMGMTPLGAVRKMAPLLTWR